MSPSSKAGLALPTQPQNPSAQPTASAAATFRRAPDSRIYTPSALGTRRRQDWENSKKPKPDYGTPSGGSYCLGVLRHLYLAAEARGAPDFNNKEAFYAILTSKFVEEPD